ncbi:hypothetical protein [Allobaculum sp. Allo2]|uniref:hypothetical protein n=1 Tax=Allobaculum sp. Allo2 TaxID=2853432 RepID=UPI001F625840|nr:hypothetical protein [Allobaculum sp. Allo2]
MVIQAVSVHNKLSIPDMDTGFQRVLDQILRDADKVDIFRVSAKEDPMDTTGAPLSALKTQTITPAVYEALVEDEALIVRAGLPISISGCPFSASFLI